MVRWKSRSDWCLKKVIYYSIWLGLWEVYSILVSSLSDNDDLDSLNQSKISAKLNKQNVTLENFIQLFSPIDWIKFFKELGRRSIQWEGKISIPYQFGNLKVL